MEKVRYMISDAANLTQVEAHVLRYWEDELDLTIPRNEMGHRYYTKENIDQFLRIKDLKEQGYQLKAIRMILHSGDESADGDVRQQAVVTELETGNGQLASGAADDLSATQNASPAVQQRSPAAHKLEMDADERMAQFRELMCDIVGHAIAINNEELSQNIGREVGERVLKEMDYLAREQSDAEEERFRKLDEAIRGSIRAKHKTFFAKDKPKAVKLSRKDKKKGRKQEAGNVAAAAAT